MTIKKVILKYYYLISSGFKHKTLFATDYTKDLKNAYV
jgi:hypothetical protein